MRRVLVGGVIALGLAMLTACLPDGTQCHNWYADNVALLDQLNNAGLDPAAIDAIVQQIHDNTLNYATYCELG